jgi:uncharacterized membrane protein YhaH (DUF805 family)
MLLLDLLAVARSGAGSAIGLKVFFAALLLLVVAGGLYMFRIRDRLFSHKGDPSDSYASGNLRMWMALLVWIHAVVILVAMIYRV